MQVSSLSAQLGLGSELVDWYWDATSVPYVIYWLTSRHAQTIEYVIVQTPDPFPQSFISQTGWNSKKFCTMNKQDLSTLQVLQSFSPQMLKSFLSGLPKRNYQVSLQMHNKFAQGKAPKHKKASRDKVPERGSTFVSKTYNLEAKKRHSGVGKGLTAH